jgi:hypothetical protein
MLYLSKSVLLVLLPLCAHAHVTPLKEADAKRSLESAESALQRVWEGIKCLGECRKTWGWHGNHFGSDPWGGVLNIGDPMPYDGSGSTQPSTPINDSGSRNSVVTSATSSSEGAFGILDVTTGLARTSTSLSVPAVSLVTFPQITT